MSREAGLNLNAKKSYIEAEEKKLKENNFLRQYNINFEDYKREINNKIFNRDQEEIEKLNDIQQPKFLYNNFPLILGIIFVVFGIYILMSDKGNSGENLYYQVPQNDLAKMRKEESNKKK